MPQDPTPTLTPERLAALQQIPYADVPSPSYIIHMGRLEENAQQLAAVRQRCGAKILLAQKGFACPATYPMLAKYLDGTTASGLHEALLAREFFGNEVHVYSPAFKQTELDKISTFAHTVVFNSLGQFDLFADKLRQANSAIEIGMRINPEHSTVETDLYNPASAESRLGMTHDALIAALNHRRPDTLAIDGLHFHTLCEQDSDDLESTAKAFENKFADFDLARLKWLNFGGGHHITRPGYDADRLCRLLDYFKNRYKLEVYLEPGEAVALHTGVLVASVLDIVPAGSVNNAILDISATCHMPDVLEMPYRPGVLKAGAPGARPFTYRLGGMSCLAGDCIGDYSFDQPLEPGQRVVFLDMAHYTMVKTTTFNGVPLPSIALYHEDDTSIDIIRTFGYEDYRCRLG